MARWIGTNAGFLSSSDPAAHFGLGAASSLDELEVLWPSGARAVYRDLAADRVHTISAEEPPATERSDG